MSPDIAPCTACVILSEVEGSPEVDGDSSLVLRMKAPTGSPRAVGARDDVPAIYAAISEDFSRETSTASLAATVDSGAVVAGW